MKVSEILKWDLTVTPRQKRAHIGAKLPPDVELDVRAGDVIAGHAVVNVINGEDGFGVDVEPVNWITYIVDTCTCGVTRQGLMEGDPHGGG